MYAGPESIDNPATNTIRTDKKTGLTANAGDVIYFAGNNAIRIYSITIIQAPPPESGNVEINIIVPEDKGGDLLIDGGTSTVISRTGTAKTVTFTVTNPDTNHTYKWLVDGTEEGTGDSITFDADNFSFGYHTVRLMIVIAGNPAPWTSPAELSFTVQP